MIRREKINQTVSSILNEEADVEPCILEDYEKLKAKCDEVIVKIRTRKVRKSVRIFPQEKSKA